MNFEGSSLLPPDLCNIQEWGEPKWPEPYYFWTMRTNLQGLLELKNIRFSIAFDFSAAKWESKSNCTSITKKMTQNKTSLEIILWHSLRKVPINKSWCSPNSLNLFLQLICSRKLLNEKPLWVCMKSGECLSLVVHLV